MVPALAGQSLLSGEFFSEAGYISVCDGDEVNLYDIRNTRIIVSEEAVLRGWFCPHTNIWRIPIQSKVTDLKKHTLILDGPNGTELLNLLYVVPSYARMLKHIEIFKNHRPSPAEAINNVYELPSIEPAIRYLHGAAGLPTKATWIKAIRNGSYLSWPLGNIKCQQTFTRVRRNPKRAHAHPTPRSAINQDPPPQQSPYSKGSKTHRRIHTNTHYKEEINLHRYLLPQKYNVN